MKVSKVEQSIGMLRGNDKSKLNNFKPLMSVLNNQGDME